MFSQLSLQVHLAPTLAAMLDREHQTKGIRDANKDTTEPLQEPTPELPYPQLMEDTLLETIHNTFLIV